MKKTWTFILLLSMLLTGCAGAEPAGDGSSVEDPAQQAQERVLTEAAVPKLSAAQTEAQARPLTEEEVLAAYDRAVRAYSWFEMSPLTYGEENCTVDGRRYYIVEYPGFQDLDDLRAYLKDLFAPSVVERLLAANGGDPVYVEVEGALYAAPIRRFRDPFKGAVETEAVQNADGSFSVNVMVELLNEDQTAVTGIECCSFPYELVDGRWVFTDFRLVN